MEKLKLHADPIIARYGQHTVNEIEKEIVASKRHLLDGDAEGNGFLGWVDLPETYDKDEYSRLKADVARLSGKGSLFVVIGIGGSYLGTRMVVEALQSEFAPRQRGSKPLVIYAGHTLSEDYYSQLLNIIDHEDYTVAVISKSGTTTEPAVAFRIVKAHLENKYGKSEAAQRIVAITDAHHGALHDIAAKEGYPTYVIPDNVGGRFSVLTPVGLLPIAMAGFDTDSLLRGARDMRQQCLASDSLGDNPALMYAAVRNLLYRQGFKVEMLVSSIPNLRYMAEWWKQLYGESEGKNHKGLLPHSITTTTDLHSMGQYVQDGERLMFETVLTVKEPRSTVVIPHDPSDLDGINYLAGRRLTEINACATRGTIEAHTDGGVPVIEIEVGRLDEYTIGQLIYFFEFACGVSGYTLGVNPFNQPGVEAYKKNMFRLLGKPGF